MAVSVVGVGVDPQGTRDVEDTARATGPTTTTIYNVIVEAAALVSKTTPTAQVETATAVPAALAPRSDLAEVATTEIAEAATTMGRNQIVATATAAGMEVTSARHQSRLMTNVTDARCSCSNWLHDSDPENLGISLSRLVRLLMLRL